MPKYGLTEKLLWLQSPVSFQKYLLSACRVLYMINCIILKSWNLLNINFTSLNVFLVLPMYQCMSNSE